MNRCLTTLFILAGLLLAGCRSDCAQLCERQAECRTTAAAAAKGELSIEKRSELCRTVCEAMLQDPDKRSEAERAIACSEKPCGEFSACINAAAQQ